MSDVVDRLLALEDVTTRPGVSAEQIEAFETRFGVELAPSHRKLLMRTNGVEVYGGYFRVFGIGPEAAIAIEDWNAPNNWKFAWRGRADDKLCIGETAMGDQFALERQRDAEALRDAVLFLSHGDMQPAFELGPFDAFLESTLIRAVTEPFSSEAIAARRRFGDLDPGKLLILAPPLSVTGEADIHVERLSAMTARHVMIVMGDVATQLDAADPPEAPVASLSPYIDGEGNPRMKVNFAAPTSGG